MSKLTASAKTAYNSLFLRYLFLRYLAYGIQFINSIILLSVLGAYPYGIYGFGLMLISYISYFNLGLNQSVNTLLAVKKDKENIRQNVWSTALTINLIISAILFVINALAITINPDLWSKYEYWKNSYLIVSIGLVINTNLMFVALYRIYNKYGRINYNQIIAPLIVLLAAIILKNKLNVTLLFFLILLANLSSLLSFFYKSPLKNKLLLKWKLVKIVLYRGINLMLYSFSFQFITLSATTLISILYPAEELGYFTLAVSVASALVMLIGSLWFMIYPTTLNRLSTSDKGTVLSYINKIQHYYVFGVDSILILAIAFMVFSVKFAPEYTQSVNALRVLLIGQLIISSTNGFSSLLITRKKEFEMTKAGLLSVIFVVLISLSIYLLQGDFYEIGYSISAGSFIYSFIVIKKSLLLLDIKETRSILKYIFPSRKLLMILLIIISNFINADYIIYTILLVVFVVSISLRHKDLTGMIKKIIRDNDVFKI